MEATLLILAPLSHKAVDVAMEIYLLSERLDDGHHPGAKLCDGCGPKVGQESLDGRLAE